MVDFFGKHSLDEFRKLAVMSLETFELISTFIFGFFSVISFGLSVYLWMNL